MANSGLQIWKMQSMLLRSAVDFWLCLWCTCDDPEVIETQIITRTCLWDLVNRNSKSVNRYSSKIEYRFTFRFTQPQKVNYIKIRLLNHFRLPLLELVITFLANIMGPVFFFNSKVPIAICNFSNCGLHSGLQMG